MKSYFSNISDKSSKIIWNGSSNISERGRKLLWLKEFEMIRKELQREKKNIILRVQKRV